MWGSKNKGTSKAPIVLASEKLFLDFFFVTFLTAKTRQPNMTTAVKRACGRFKCRAVGKIEFGLLSLWQFRLLTVENLGDCNQQTPATVAKSNATASTRAETARLPSSRAPTMRFHRKRGPRAREPRSSANFEKRNVRQAWQRKYITASMAPRVHRQARRRHHLAVC